MAKHTKLTKLKLSAVTAKRRTLPHGIGMTIELPHDLAVKWADKAGKVLLDISKEIAAELESLKAPVAAETPAVAPTPAPVAETQDNANLAQP
jgi:hypothetical protein